MGIPVLILGESGSGKTFAIKNMNPDEVGIFLVEKPRLPFRKQFKVCRDATYYVILKALADPKLKQYVIDDSQYIMANEFFDRAGETGYQKFVDIGANFRNLIHFVIRKVPDDVIVYFLHHTDKLGSVMLRILGNGFQHFRDKGQYHIFIDTVLCLAERSDRDFGVL